MATSSIQKDINLEGYSLICLGVNLDKEEKQLRTLINHFKIFDDTLQCEQYISCTPNYNRIIFIINDQLGRELIPRIHQLQQISSIYIHCIDEQLKHEWIKQYTKIKSIHVHLDDLIVQLQSNQMRRNRNRADEILSISIFKENIDEEKSTTGLDGHFLHSQRLIDCLLRTKPSSFDKDELISLCYEQYQDNEIELNILREFEERYSSDFAIWWYTRESFLYKMLNKALRIQNIDIMFLFRFFIRDIQQQLELNQYSSFIRVYRGQLMSTEELKILQNSIGELISVNSFLSTSIDRHLALFYLGTTESLHFATLNIKESNINMHIIHV